MEEQDKSIKSYIGDIVNTARERRDKQDYVIEQLVKRMDGLEEQQKMQMQIVLQNQQNITEFIAAQRQQQQPPTLPKKRPSSR
jgi:ATP phosphoribosyltransferase